MGGGGGGDDAGADRKVLGRVGGGGGTMLLAQAIKYSQFVKQQYLIYRQHGLRMSSLKRAW